MSVPLTCDLNGGGRVKCERRATTSFLSGARVVLVMVAALHVNVEGEPPQSRRCKRTREVAAEVAALSAKFEAAPPPSRSCK